MGKRTWTATHALFLKKLFSEGTANPSDTGPAYMRSVFNDHDIFRENIPKERNFFNNYRKVANEYILDQTRSGARRGGEYRCFILIII